jgi:hypothetical protein
LQACLYIKFHVFLIQGSLLRLSVVSRTYKAFDKIALLHK